MTSFYSTYNEEQAVRFLSYLNEKVGAENTPVFYLRGNHEIRNAYSIQLRELFDYVGDKTYGAFNWGDTRFIMLDCGEDKPDTTWVYYNLNNYFYSYLFDNYYFPQGLIDMKYNLALPNHPHQ